MLHIAYIDVYIYTHTDIDKFARLANILVAKNKKDLIYKKYFAPDIKLYKITITM